MSILNKRLPLGKDLGYSVLDGSVDDSQTTITVSASAPFPTIGGSTNRRRFIPAIICPGADPATLTFADLQSGEHIAIIGHEAASTTLTVIRGDSPVSHDSGSLIMIMPTARAWESAFNYLATLESVMAVMLGAPVAGDGVIMNFGVDESSFKATQNGTPNMTVNVAPGIGAYRDQVFRSLTTVSLAFTAPDTETRVDIIAWDVIADELVVIDGTEGAGAPEIPAAHVGLWEVAIDVAQTSILNADMTDIRDFA